jgi:hypothetical protein
LTGGTIVLRLYSTQRRCGGWRHGTGEATKISYSTRSAARQQVWGRLPSCDCPKTRKPLSLSGRRIMTSRARKRCVDSSNSASKRPRRKRNREREARDKLFDRFAKRAPRKALRGYLAEKLSARTIRSVSHSSGHSATVGASHGSYDDYAARALKVLAATLSERATSLVLEQDWTRP